MNDTDSNEEADLLELAPSTDDIMSFDDLPPYITDQTFSDILTTSPPQHQYSEYNATTNVSVGIPASSHEPATTQTTTRTEASYQHQQQPVCQNPMIQGSEMPYTYQNFQDSHLQNPIHLPVYSSQHPMYSDPNTFYSNQQPIYPYPQPIPSFPSFRPPQPTFTQSQPTIMSAPPPYHFHPAQGSHPARFLSLPPPVPSTSQTAPTPSHQTSKPSRSPTPPPTTTKATKNPLRTIRPPSKVPQDDSIKITHIPSRMTPPPLSVTIPDSAIFDPKLLKKIPTFTVNFYLVTDPDLKSPKVTQMCSVAGLRYPPTDYYDNLFYIKMTKLFVSHMKTVTPFKQLNKIGVRHKFYNQEASYWPEVSTQNPKPKLFTFRLPIAPNDLREIRPQIMKINEGPFIPLNIYYRLQLHKPIAEAFFLSREDKLHLSSLLTVLRNGCVQTSCQLKRSHEDDLPSSIRKRFKSSFLIPPSQIPATPSSPPSTVRSHRTRIRIKIQRRTIKKRTPTILISYYYYY